MKNLLKPKYIISLIAILIIGFIAYNALNPKPLEVNITNPEVKKIYRTLTYSGEIVAENSQNLSFGVSGEITKFEAKEGDQVEANQILATINTTTNYLAYEKAKNNLESLESDLQELKRKFEIDRNLFQDSEDVYERQREQLQKQVENAKLDIQNYSQNFTNYNLTPAISGTLVTKKYNVGESVAAYSTVATVADLSGLYFETYVDIEDIENVSIGQKVLVTLDTNLDKKIEGNITDIAKITTTDATGDKTVKVKIALNEENLVLGTTGDAQIVLEESPTEVLTIPFDTVLRDENKSYIYIVDQNNKVQRKEINIIMEGDLDYQINEMLQEDTKIILDPDTTLTDNTLVSY